MNQNKTSIIFTVLIVVMAVSFSIGIQGKAHNHGPSVEEIYQSIRYATPLYQCQESIVTFENDGMTLVCTLTVPDTNWKCPIVITLAGFIGTRDEEPIAGSDDTVFGRQCHVLAGQGIASLRVDYRGYGDSQGDFAQDCNFSTQVSDIRAAVDSICRDLKHQVDCKSIGILGFSQGGLVASCTAARDKRVDSLVLWSPVTHPPIIYGGLLTSQGLKQGLALQDGGTITLGLYLDGQYLGFDITLGKKFFQDLFNMDPIAEIRKFNKPLMAIAGLQDPVIWPQPAMTDLYMKYHNGEEKLVVIDAGHEFNYWDESDTSKLDDAIYWSAAWFIKTLKNKNQ